MGKTDRITIYQIEDGQATIKPRLENDMVWLNQKMILELFQTTKWNISFHSYNCFAEGELERERTFKEYLTVRREGKHRIERRVDYYALDGTTRQRLSHHPHLADCYIQT